MRETCQKLRIKEGPIFQKLKRNHNIYLFIYLLLGGGGVAGWCVSHLVYVTFMIESKHKKKGVCIISLDEFDIEMR